MSSDIRLIGTHRITATLVLKSGLHVGAGKDAIEIGGVDSPVVKNPFTQEPYIPGSSLKGKLRSLLEWTLDCVEPNGGVWGSGGDSDKYQPDDIVLRVFGTTIKDWKGGPTRLVVRDAPLDGGWAKNIREQGLAFTEEKTEVSIDRIQGRAKNGGLRRIERVPAGAHFRLEMIYKVFDTDDGGRTDHDGLNRVLEALKLLESDALGGSGSRGYGRVQVQNLRIDGEDIQKGFENITAVSKNAPNGLVGASHG